MIYNSDIIVMIISDIIIVMDIIMDIISLISIIIMSIIITNNHSYYIPISIVIIDH